MTNRVLGIDYGLRRVGIAVSDLLGWTAQGLETIEVNVNKEDYGIDRLKEIVFEYDIQHIVLGMPKNMNNSVGFRGEETMEYYNILQNELPYVKITLWDERLSTMGASRALLEADVSRKKRKNVIDKMAAVFILQGYLDSQQ
ncbi:Holliday junction resolvase RuvX [Abyssicoccus albus]|uniref:Putative pre-16S rRNA nuclease n=1 Tax=Abyssicoccus albus TaxID=1817405 RepID=A0A3N5BJX6_9BACL|nr:Holliday junction resolvase RuvX [Abyssicoccus albus]RPF58176.1 putative Holliday junction resolvase [Abyssicoccus albus]